MSSTAIKQRIRKCVFELNQLFSQLLNEIVLSTKTLTDTNPLSKEHIPQSAHLQLQLNAQRDSIMKLTNDLIRKDRELQLLLDELIEHQKFQQKINELQQLVDQKNNQLNHLSNTLQKVHGKLLETIHETKPVLESCTVKTKRLNLNDLLSYAYSIRGTTSGPPSDEKGLETVYFESFPVQQQISQSLLYPKNLKALRQRKEQEKQTEQALAEFAEHRPLIAFNRATLSSPRAATMQSPRSKPVIRLFGDSDEEDEDE